LQLLQHFRLVSGKSIHISFATILAWLAPMSTAPPIDERAFRFFCDVIRFVRTITPEPGVRRLADQMISSAGSIAANREEATSGTSRKEFIRYNEIALRSAKESVVWLRGCEATSIGDPRQSVGLLSEARQLAKILGAIVVNSKRAKGRARF
jgi:four helix bundle protein